MQSMPSSFGARPNCSASAFARASPVGDRGGSSGGVSAFSACRMTNTVVVEAAPSIQTAAAIITMPASAASQTGASKGRRLKLAYSLRMSAMILRPWVVLLAGGGSRRFRRPKLLSRLDGETLLRRAARLALDCDAAGCMVVLGANAIRLERELRGLPVTLVINRHWRRGLSTSLRADAPAALVVLADQAALGPADLALLMAASRRQPRAIVASCAGVVIGPPAIFPRRVFRDLRRLRGDAGAKALLEDPSRFVIKIGIGNAGLDVDRPEDLDRW